MLEVAVLTKRYGAMLALDGVSLAVAEGELVAVLGPSGCGKTSLLRVVAGFVQPDRGVVRIGGRDMTREPPERRRLGMVFQGPSLWPHMSVAENVAFGLRARRRPAGEIDRRVAAVLALVQLENLAGRRPDQLSGGQQQRVALARAIVYEPSLLLLDEPFSALDRRLRDELQREVGSLQRRLGITALFVTHDQDEAMRMADRIALMRHGRIEQLGTAEHLYGAPANRFAAEFLGEANLIEGSIERSGEGSRFVAAIGFTLELPAREVEGPARVMLRPEAVMLVKADARERRLAGTVSEVSFQGATSRVSVVLDFERVEIRALVLGSPPQAGDRVGLGWTDGAPILLRD